MTYKVLVIAYPFPPSTVGESIRVVKFIKYLPRFGWEPVVLSLENRSPRSFGGYDPPPNVEIYRTGYFGPHHNVLRLLSGRRATSGVASSHKRPGMGRRLGQALRRWFIPDEYVGWLPFAAKQSQEIVARHQIDLLFSTSPYHTCQLVGMSLARRTGKPWVADFRDPWTQNPFVNSPTRIYAGIESWLERRVLTRADRVVTISEPIRDGFLAKYPELDRGKMLVIPNGYDPEDFQGITADQHRDKFVLVHTGSLYGSRDPTSFLLAVRDLLARRADLHDKLIIRFIGPSPDLRWMVDRWGLSEVVQVSGPVPHRESLTSMARADVLLVIAGPGAGVLTGKIFEYLAVQKPILALTSEGSALARLMRDVRAGLVLKDDDTPGISRALEDLYRRWSEDELAINPDEEVIRRYSRQLLTQELATIFDELVASGER